MKEELFTKILESVREGGVILRGEQSPSRRFTVEKPGVQQIGANYRLSQKEFASMLGITKGALQIGNKVGATPRDPSAFCCKLQPCIPRRVGMLKPFKVVAHESG